MPYPQNVETARAVEAIIRGIGAVPATIAILDGECCIGLDEEQLERFGKLGTAGEVSKVSRRDLACVIARRGHGGTTVASTMLLAHMAGISTFVTGGIGGVHRGGELSMDVSADLNELGRTPVCVVCAGAKSILDIPRTLEYLETQGVTVIAVGSDDFPAFFTRHSGCRAPLRIESPSEAAAVVHASERLGLLSGALVGVPIPEEAEAEAAVVQAAIDCALEEAEAGGVMGREMTPFLLKRINEITDGQSLMANIALIKNNAKHGAALAVALAELRQAERAIRMPPSTPTPSTPTRRVVVVGGAVADLVACPASGTELVSSTSSPGSLKIMPGGVGRNMAEGLHRCGCSPLLISAIGTDSLGEYLSTHAASLPSRDRYSSLPSDSSFGGLSFEAVCRVPGMRTATYTAMMDSSGDLLEAVADMDILQHISPEHLLSYHTQLTAAPLIIADANLPPQTLATLAGFAAPADGTTRRQPLLWLEPVSVVKAASAIKGLRASRLIASLAFTSPNEDEVIAMAMALGDGPQDAAPGNQDTGPDNGRLASVRREGRREGRRWRWSGWSARDEGYASADESVRSAAAALVRAGISHVLVTRGARGVLWARTAESGDGDVEIEEMAAIPVDAVVSTRGAGDCFVAAAAIVLQRIAIDRAEDANCAGAVRAAVRAGLKAAQISILSDEAVPHELSTVLEALHME